MGQKRPFLSSEWGGLLAGLAPFLVFSAVLAAGIVAARLAALLGQSEDLFRSAALLGRLTLPLACLAMLTAGWVKGFPRWVFPYWGMAVPLSLWLFGRSFRPAELIYWQAWLLPALAMVAGLALTRSIGPLGTLVSGIRTDWSRLSFAVYGALPLSLLAAFDQVRGGELFLAGLGLVLSGGVLAFWLSLRGWQRALALLCGLAFSWSLAAQYLAGYWNGRLEPGMLAPGFWTDTVYWMYSLGAFWIGLLLAPAVLGLFRRPAFGWAPFWAGLPHLLFFMLAGAGKLKGDLFPDYSFEPFVEWVVLFLTLLYGGVLLLAWRRGWPLWSASWYGYFLWWIVALSTLANLRLKIFNEDYFANILIVGGLALFLVLYFWLIWRDPLKGILAVFFMLPVAGLMLLEFVPDRVEGFLSLGLGLLIALAAAATVRLGRIRSGILIALGSNLLAGLAFSYVSVYQAEYPVGYSYTPSVLELAFNLAFYLAAVSVLFLGFVAMNWIWILGAKRLIR